MRLVRALRGIRVIRLLRPPSSKSQGWTLRCIGCAHTEQQTPLNSQRIVELAPVEFWAPGRQSNFFTCFSLRYVSALRTLVFSIVSTMSSLLWTLVLLLLLFYSCAAWSGCSGCSGPFLSDFDPRLGRLLGLRCGVVRKDSTVTRIGCVWDEILVAVDGFGTAMCEKCALSQGFGMFGPGHAAAGGWANREAGAYMKPGMASSFPSWMQHMGHCRMLLEKTSLHLVMV